jgi:hypothetical protein
MGVQHVLDGYEGYWKVTARFQNEDGAGEYLVVVRG